MNASSMRLSCFVVILLLAGCEKAKHPTALVHPVQEVGVVTLKPQKVAITVELPGRITAFRVSDVRPQVDGIILKRLFNEGGDVTEVQAQGVRVVKSTKNFLLVMALVSTDGSMSSADIGDFIASNIQDPVSRTFGVGDYQLLGSQYAMRVWLDPTKLDNYSLTPGDVSEALEAQNVQISSGELGGLPSISKQQLNATVIGPSRLQRPEEFREILLKVNSDGSQVRLRDVATIGLGPQDYSITSKYNGRPAASIGLKLTPGGNALKTIEAIEETIKKLEPIFPPGLEVKYPYDTSPSIKGSIEAVVHTLFEAILLVFLVMFLFLQSIRATLIPTLVVTPSYPILVPPPTGVSDFASKPPMVILVPIQVMILWRCHSVMFPKPAKLFIRRPSRFWISDLRWKSELGKTAAA